MSGVGKPKHPPPQREPGTRTNSQSVSLHNLQLVPPTQSSSSSMSIQENYNVDHKKEQELMQRRLEASSNQVNSMQYQLDQLTELLSTKCASRAEVLALQKSRDQKDNELRQLHDSFEQRLEREIIKLKNTAELESKKREQEMASIKAELVSLRSTLSHVITQVKGFWGVYTAFRNETEQALAQMKSSGSSGLQVVFNNSAVSGDEHFRHVVEVLLADLKVRPDVTSFVEPDQVTPGSVVLYIVPLASVRVTDKLTERFIRVHETHPDGTGVHVICLHSAKTFQDIKEELSSKKPWFVCESLQQVMWQRSDNDQIYLFQDKDGKTKKCLDFLRQKFIDYEFVRVPRTGFTLNL